MQCPQCQHENREGRRFCAECGSPLDVACSVCAFVNEPGEKFCGGCGVALAGQQASPRVSHPVLPSAADPEREPLTYTPRHLAEKILTSRNDLEGERKHVTIMFADIKDSTELIQDLDPEDAQKLLDPAIHIMMDAVHRFEGTVNQVLGDGIMVLFGAPIAHEDYAIRACYAALAMQTAMQDYSENMRRTQGIEMRIRVGLNSGEVVVRAIGNDLHMDYSAVGQTTHLAARMEQLATPGQIRLPATMLRLVEGWVQVNALGPIPVKGMTEPVEVLELVGVTASRSRLQAAMPRGLTRFVGRHREVDALSQALAQARDGHGQIVAVVGEAGVGKSRLFYEFVHSHRTQGCLYLESGAVSYGNATPYLLVTGLLKHYFQLEDTNPAQRVREQVTGKALTLDEQLKDAIPPLLFLLEALPEAHPLGTREPSSRHGLVLDALKRLLVLESQRQPLLLVFEDLHWVDVESQAVLDMLVGSLPTSPILVLTNYRPEYDDPWTAKTYYTRLRVDPLPSQDADDLLEALLGSDASLEALKVLLKTRTGSNPFFLEESVRTLIETEVLDGSPGVYRMKQEPDTLQIPATVQALLAARIDRLPEEAKHLLQSAAVIGTEIPLALLQDLADLSKEAFRHGLNHLQRAEFLYETRLFPESEYTFKHALTHDVAYASLLHDRRRQLHRQLGEVIESHYADRLPEFAEILANHFERGEDRDKAVRYYLQAAEKAKDQHAYSSAVQFCTRALELAAQASASGEECVQGRILLGNLWSLLGDVDQANQNYDQAIQASTDTATQQRVANTRHRLHVAIRDGGKIAYYEHGSGDTLLVFALPVAYDPAGFQPVVEKLSQEFRLITIEPRGRGASDPLSGPYSLRQHAEDVRAVIEATAATGPIVGIGLSLSGTVLVKLVTTYPILLHKLVLISTNPSFNVLNATQAWLDAYRDHLRQEEKEQALRILASILYPEPEAGLLAEQMVQALLSVPTDILLRHYDANSEYDMVALLPQVQVPTLVMRGTADQRTPLDGVQVVVNHIPKAQLYTFKDKGHWLIRTATTELCEVLRRFVRTGETSARLD